MSDQGELFVTFAVHCFTCPVTVRSHDPVEAHDLMEAHYREKHGPLIGRIVGVLG